MTRPFTCKDETTPLLKVAPELLDIAKRHRHLLSELHGGNAFSKDYLWRALAETQTLIEKAGAL